MRKYLLIYFILICTALQGQELSIQEVWKNADKNFIYQQNNISLLIAEQELLELKNDRLPLFYIDANLQRNLIIPTTPVPAIAFDPNAAEGAIIPLKFATKWSSKAGIQMEWNIFDPKRKTLQQEKELAKQKAAIEKSKNQQSWYRDATLAYAAVVLATEQYQLAIEDSTLYEEVLKITKARYDEGRETYANYLIAQQEYEQKRIQLHESWGVLLDADLELRHYVEIENRKTLSTSIESITNYVEKIQPTNYTLESLSIDQQLSALDQKNIKKELLPTVSSNAYLGEQYFSNELRLGNKNEWFGNSFANVALRIPLSAYFTAKPSLRKAILNYDLATAKFEEEKSKDAIFNQQKSVKAQTIKHKLKSLEHLVELHSQQKDTLYKSYLTGRTLINDYNKALVNFNKANQDVWQAKYDLLDTLLQ